MSSIFTKVINREIPANIIDETDGCIAFLDIMPCNPGHALAIPKREVENWTDLSDEEVEELFVFAKKVGRKIQNAMNCKKIGLKTMGFDIPHVHIHLIPLHKSGAEMDIANTKKMSKSELGAAFEKIMNVN